MFRNCASTAQDLLAISYSLAWWGATANCADLAHFWKGGKSSGGDFHSLHSHHLASMDAHKAYGVLCIVFGIIYLILLGIFCFKYKRDMRFKKARYLGEPLFLTAVVMAVFQSVIGAIVNLQ